MPDLRLTSMVCSRSTRPMSASAPAKRVLEVRLSPSRSLRCITRLTRVEDLADVHGLGEVVLDPELEAADLRLSTDGSLDRNISGISAHLRARLERATSAKPSFPGRRVSARIMSGSVSSVSSSAPSTSPDVVTL